MKIIHLTCGHRIQVRTWPSKAGLAKVRHHYKKFHPARMKKMTKKSLATKRKRGLINPKMWQCKRCRHKFLPKDLVYNKRAKGNVCYNCDLILSKKKRLVRNKCKPNPHPTLIYDRLLGIEAHKSHGKFKGQNFTHSFKHDTDAMVMGNPDGSLTIKSKRGKRLWRKFKY